MMMAALNGDLDFVNLLIAKDAEVNKKGWAPLHYAATNGHDDIVKVLLDHSAYIDAGSPNGTTPLMMAARGGHVSTVKLLLDNGADLTREEPDRHDGARFREEIQGAGRGGRADRAPAADAAEVNGAAQSGTSGCRPARSPGVASSPHAASGLLRVAKQCRMTTLARRAGAPFGRGERPPDKRPWKGTPCCGL